MTGTPDRVADYTVKIAFGGLLSNNLHFSPSDQFFETAGVPVFRTDWTASFTGAYDDVTLDIADGTSVTVSRGQNAKFSSIESGKAAFQLLNTQNPVLYDPNDPSSPLVDAVESPGFVPMRPVQIQGSPYVLGTGGTPQGLFYGFLRTASFDPLTKICTINCEDLVYWLARLNAPVIAVQTGITSSAAVQLLLKALGWTDASLTILEPNPAIRSMTFSSDGSQTALDLLQGILDAEQGYVFVDGNGAFHFEGRYARDNRRTATASFGEAELVGLTSDLDADQIINQVAVTAASGGGGAGTDTPQVANDLASQTTFGIASSSGVSSPYLASDSDALSLANLILQRCKSSRPPQQAIVDNSTAVVLAAQMLLNPQDRVNIGAGALGLTYANLVKSFLPKLYWRLGETVGAGTAADASGNGNTGTYGSGVTLGQTGAITGDADTAAALNNTATALVDAAYNPFVAGSKRTFMGWAYRLATTDTDGLITSAGATNSLGLQCAIGNNNVVWQTGGASVVNWTAAWPGIGQWVFWAVTYDDSTLTAELFINGASQGAQVLTGAGYGVTGPVRLGNFFGTTFPWNGYLDEFVVFESLLSAAAIQAIYAGGLAVGSGFDCFVESVAHEIKAGGVYHSTTLSVSRAPTRSVFEFGVSTFASSDYFG